MARIFLKLAKTEPIYISNDRAKELAKDKKKFEDKEIENVWMNVDNFNGYLSDIRSIVLDEETRQTLQTTKYEPLTDEERARNKAAMQRIRENLFGKKTI